MPQLLGCISKRKTPLCLYVKAFPSCSRTVLWLSAAASFFSLNICVSSGSIWALILYKVLLLDQLTCFQRRHICLRLVYKTLAEKLHASPLRLLCLSAMESLHANFSPFCLFSSMLMVLHGDYCWTIAYIARSWSSGAILSSVCCLINTNSLSCNEIILRNSIQNVSLFIKPNFRLIHFSSEFFFFFYFKK